jgi:hypothetical protein
MQASFLGWVAAVALGAMAVSAPAWAQDAPPPPPPPAAPPAARAVQGPPPYHPPPPVYYAPPPYTPAQPYPPPYYGPPPQYAPPPAPYPAYRPQEQGPPPVVYGWDPDRPAPDGYRLVSTPNGRLIGVGIGLFSAGYVTAVVSAAVAAKVEEDDAAEDLDGIQPEDWSMLYIPVAGPFITITTVDASPSGMGLLIADGLVQTGGILSFVLGLVDREHKILRVDRPDVGVLPGAPGATTGMTLAGSF